MGIRQSYVYGLPGAVKTPASQRWMPLDRSLAEKLRQHKVVNLVLPAQLACELNVPLSSLANLQLIVRKGNIGRGGGDRNCIPKF